MNTEHLLRRIFLERLLMYTEPLLITQEMDSHLEMLKRKQELLKEMK